jgi:hypothetical protein
VRADVGCLRRCGRVRVWAGVVWAGVWAGVAGCEGVGVGAGVVWAVGGVGGCGWV